MTGTLPLSPHFQHDPERLFHPEVHRGEPLRGQDNRFINKSFAVETTRPVCYREAVPGQEQIPRRQPVRSKSMNGSHTPPYCRYGTGLARDHTGELCNPCEKRLAALRSGHRTCRRSSRTPSGSMAPSPHNTSAPTAGLMSPHRLRDAWHSTTTPSRRRREQVLIEECGLAALPSTDHCPDLGGDEATDADVGADDTRQLVAGAQFSLGDCHGQPRHPDDEHGGAQANGRDHQPATVDPTLHRLIMPQPCYLVTGASCTHYGEASPCPGGGGECRTWTGWSGQTVHVTIWTRAVVMDWSALSCAPRPWRRDPAAIAKRRLTSCIKHLTGRLFNREGLSPVYDRARGKSLIRPRRVTVPAW